MLPFLIDIALAVSYICVDVSVFSAGCDRLWVWNKPKNAAHVLHD